MKEGVLFSICLLHKGENFVICAQINCTFRIWSIKREMQTHRGISILEENTKEHPFS